MNLLGGSCGFLRCVVGGQDARVEIFNLLAASVLPLASGHPYCLASGPRHWVSAEPYGVSHKAPQLILAPPYGGKPAVKRLSTAIYNKRQWAVSCQIVKNRRTQVLCGDSLNEHIRNAVVTRSEIAFANEKPPPPCIVQTARACFAIQVCAGTGGHWRRHDELKGADSWVPFGTQAGYHSRKALPTTQEGIAGKKRINCFVGVWCAFIQAPWREFPEIRASKPACG
jgi:hypothetical protein